MQVKTVPVKPVTSPAAQRRTPRVAAVRHIGSSRPRRSWSLLLAPRLQSK
jgi:hypothetical protein